MTVIARVRGVMHRRASSTDMCGRSTASMSTNTGLAPAWTTTLAVATKLSDGTRTSSPGPMSNTASMSCRAAVAECTATASSTPCNSANASSNRRTRWPMVSQPLSITSVSACFSAFPRIGAPSSMTVGSATVLTHPPRWRSSDAFAVLLC